MFKKRIRAACVAFITLIVLTLLSIIGWKVSEARSTRVGKIKVLTGTLDAVEDVEVSVGKYEYVRNVSGIGKLALTGTKWACNTTRVARVSDGKVMTAYRYKDGIEPWNRRCYVGVSENYPQKYKAGMHSVSGKEFSYDLKWYLENDNDNYREYSFVFPNYITFADEDRFFYEGTERFLLANGMEWENVTYRNNVLCELNGSMYGYVGIGPDKDFDLSEVHMTVNRGIYRFCQDGTAECVFLMEERAENFSQLWLTAEEENNVLRIIGTKENRLLMYEYSLDTGTVEEKILWKGDDAFPAWFEEADSCIFGDAAVKGNRTYLSYTDLYLNKVNLVVFEEGNRIFQGELLEREYDMESLYNFSMMNSYEYTIESSANRIDIRLTE
ncbi:MAG: hypothetical protein IJZ55_05200 [Lachnospiraceae bacterium]|nr:hypothetical protein [Lachnospiraceae bacterium]